MIILVEAALVICSIFKFISTRLNFPLNLQNCGPICDSLFPGFFHYPICPFHFSGSATSICVIDIDMRMLFAFGAVWISHFLLCLAPLANVNSFCFIHKGQSTHTHTHTHTRASAHKFKLQLHAASQTHTHWHTLTHTHHNFNRFRTVKVAKYLMSQMRRCDARYQLAAQSTSTWAALLPFLLLFLYIRTYVHMCVWFFFFFFNFFVYRPGTLHTCICIVYICQSCARCFCCCLLVTPSLLPSALPLPPCPLALVFFFFLPPPPPLHPSHFCAIFNRFLMGLHWLNA